MTRAWLVVVLLAAGGVLLWAQSGRYLEPAPFEVRQLLPREASPGRFQQVENREVQQLADAGWELVSVTPWVLMNEEHGNGTATPRPVVTQAYHAYFFKRVKMSTGR